MSRLLPVILSGGAGTRLWPASRAMYPKQLLPLAGDRTMLQATVLRAAGLPGLDDQFIVVSNEAHRFIIAEQMAEIQSRAAILLEPDGRNTAPAVAIAALHANPEDLLLVMPSDHVIQDVPSFQAAVAAGIEAAKNRKLVVFGIRPTSAETGYGYIRAKPVDGCAGPVQQFVEKPDAAAAKEYSQSESFFWNSGMFLFRADTYLAELAAHAPLIESSCRRAMSRPARDGDFIRPDSAAFQASPAVSVDHAIMEKSSIAMMVPLVAGWSDVGSWSALHDVSEQDEHGNSFEGDAHFYGCRDTYVQAESRLVATVGLENTIVVETKDAVLIADRNRCQDVKSLVEGLRSSDRPEVSLGRQVFRPWGSYDSIDSEENFQVKRLIVKPGAVLSLQKHAHRAEHWVVVKGKARITRNDDEFDLNVNESTYIAIGDIHRIANPYDEPVHIIEVQCGDYLGEDDIVRIEDNYGREGTNT